VISTREQKLALLDRGKVMGIYPVSTSKFGLGDWRGSRFTPLGQLQIAEKIGGNAPPGAVFKDRRRTGEIIQANAPGRDPIVTRILWLRGLEAQNANAFGRDIYIHGTPEEWKIGSPASYGCIRMRSSDIIQLYDIVGIGAAVTIVNVPLATAVPGLVTAHSMSAANPLQPGGRPAHKTNETVLTVYCMYQAVETATIAGRLQPHRAEATVLIRTTHGSLPRCSLGVLRESKSMSASTIIRTSS